MGNNNNERRLITLTVCVLLFLFVLGVCNAGLAAEPIKSLAGGEIGFSEFIDKIQEKYVSDDLILKDAFLNLNGGFARLTGRRVYNDIVLTNNGMLTAVVPQKNMEEMAAGICGFSSSLSGEPLNIPFLYVQTPYKEPLDGNIMPVGVNSYANENADSLLMLLQSEGVECLDLRPSLVSTTEDMEKYFFNTDHHWTYDGAFVGFQLIMERLNDMLQESGIDMAYADKSAWESHTVQDLFLGARGKRVGKYFGGVDDFSWLTPRFETNMSCAVPHHYKIYKGSFSDAIMRTANIEGKDYFHRAPYCLYIGGDYPLVQHRNAGAPSDLKVLILKDSYVLPIQSYCSAMFREVDVVDPRHYTESSIIDYVIRTEPDVVLMMVNPSLLGTKQYSELGTAGEGENPVKQPSVVLMDNSDIHNQNAYHTIAVDSGKTYRICFDDVQFKNGGSDGVMVGLYNRTANKTIYSRVYDVEYCRNYGGFEWIFETPAGSDEIELLLYAGLPGETKGNEVTYMGVTLEQY